MLETPDLRRSNELAGTKSTQAGLEQDLLSPKLLGPLGRAEDCLSWQLEPGSLHAALGE